MTGTVQTPKPVSSTLNRALRVSAEQPHAYLWSYQEPTILPPLTEKDPLILFLRNHNQLKLDGLLRPFKNYDNDHPCSRRVMDFVDWFKDNTTTGVSVPIETFLQYGAKLAEIFGHRVSIIHCYGTSQQREYQFTSGKDH